MTSVEISGTCPANLAGVKDAFVENFAERGELGARFCACIGGEVVIDIWAGHADLAKTRAFDDQTLCAVYSTTKAVAALMIARLVDQGLLDYQAPVAKLWPSFAQAGKAEVTLGEMISHQAGLPGLLTEVERDAWLDPKRIAELLAAQAPMWPLGQGSGYHPATMGYLVGEVFRRAEGRTLGQALDQDLAAPFELDIYIGLAEALDDRVAEMKKPSAPPDLGTIDEIKRAAFLKRGAVTGTPAWRRAEIPSTNGHATANGLARLMAVVANDGHLQGERILSGATLGELTRERVRGQDRVLPFNLSWAAGLTRNIGINAFGPSEAAVGHYGWGGSMAMADPSAKVSAAYVMNAQSPHLLGDPRPVSLLEAFYRSL